MMKSGKISVIIPVYNVENYLRRCVDSVINQTYTNLEIILINDGSPDNSPAICEDYKMIDKRIIVLHKDNGGLSSARNMGLDVCTGEFICFLDSDDWINPNTLTSAVLPMQQNTADLVFWSRINEYSDKSVKENPLFKTSQLFEGSSKTELHRRMVGLIGKELSNPTRTDAINSAWGKLYVSDKIQKNNIRFIDTQIVGSEDVPFIIEYMCYIESVFYLYEFFSHYWRENEQSLTKHQKNTLFPRFKNLFNRVQNVLKQNNLNNDFQLAFNNRIVCSIINCGLAIVGDNNSQNFSEKYKSFSAIIKDPVYSNAIKNFYLKDLPLHYKALFWSIKNRLILFSFVIFYAMKNLREI